MSDKKLTLKKSSLLDFFYIIAENKAKSSWEVAQEKNLKSI